MKRNRGFTITELVVTIGIIMIVAAITFPVFRRIHAASVRSNCISNLRQIGLGIALYRESFDGAAVGTPAQMGLPRDPVALIETQYVQPLLFLSCGGIAENGASYAFNFPFDSYPIEMHKFWAEYVRKHGEASILMNDTNHQPSLPRNRTWELWTGLGLQLDNAVIVRTRMGYPYSNEWWHDK